ncbi:MAG: flagellar hook-basal body complex protein [Chitinispirillaceae bacterium]|nr:flagellar hook-basal body complex protein [Chitinispirillaceae bacterium]
MLRSLYSSISGLRNHQVAMDVIGNNIANVNTVGFKAGRVTFEESMAQLLQGATRPAGNAGGTNPLQIGLGMAVGSIDTMLVQGNLQTTGEITDLAIQGRAYFAFSNGSGTYYGRNGGLQFDATGKMVSPTNGFTLQGMMAASDGTYPPGSRIGDIRVPFGEKAPAQATTEVRYACNLDSDSEALGSITHTNRFLAVAQGNQSLTSLYDENGNSLGIQEGDYLIVSVTGTGIDPQRFQVGSDPTDITTYDDLAASVQAYLRANGFDSATVTITPTGQLQVSNGPGGASINGLQIRSSRPGSNSYVANAFSFPPSIAGSSTSAAGVILRPAIATDLLANCFDMAGQTLGLEAGDEIKINGAVGGRAISELVLTYDPATTNIQTLITGIQQAFRLPATDGTVADNPSVSINLADTPNDRLPDGSIVIRGQPEQAFAITSVSITATNSNSDLPSPARFIANMGFTEIQQARDTGQHSASILVYDQSGDAHTLVLTFTHSGVANEWLWNAQTEGGEEILGGSSGRVTFGQDGSPSSFTYDDGSTAFRFDPMNGSNIVSVNLNVGTPGSFLGVTQFRSDTTTVAREQNGYPMGKLQEISIDERGEIFGVYTNGVSKSIARIYVAEFNNPAGLLKLGDSMYAVSNNSGEAVLQRPGIGSASTIKPGSIEMSNVELATEFTSMITTQRGYQANARVITTSDQLLQELVQLVR